MLFLWQSLDRILKMPFYAVAKGRQVGIYNTWPECQQQVNGFTGARFKKFATESEANNFVQQNSGGSSAVSSTNWGRGSTDDDGFVHVYTDGSCEGNGQAHAAAGLGVYFGEGHALNTAQPVSGRATNNCGEIQAASMAIRLARAQGVRRLMVNTDSQFLINSITKWLPGWKRRNWTLASGGEVKNKTDFQELERELSSGDIEIKWNHVDAHCGIAGNERADELARQGTQMYRTMRRGR
ncbi:ribonuclease H1 [Anopheles ziemanni]|uniref:ribonuclease H1 n=1 Tax=Anopheles ziemanni TaxID=345580 RepID=UPI00265A7243|nr:ribonuclease H1 isoform X2 [Anopheles coustani]XP_058177648.1 ribonuclease H1 [Anopheles ziemanni]